MSTKQLAHTLPHTIESCYFSICSKHPFYLLCESNNNIKLYIPLLSTKPCPHMIDIACQQFRGVSCDRQELPYNTAHYLYIT